MNFAKTDTIQVTPKLTIPLAEVELHAIRSAGVGGQKVNKVSSAIHLRFDISTSSLPEHIKARLLRLHDRRVSREGIVVIKAQEYRTQAKNRQAALERLGDLIRRATAECRQRVPTCPTRAARQKRLEVKCHRSRLKKRRRPVTVELE